MTLRELKAYIAELEKGNLVDLDYDVVIKKAGVYSVSSVNGCGTDGGQLIIFY